MARIFLVQNHNFLSWSLALLGQMFLEHNFWQILELCFAWIMCMDWISTFYVQTKGLHCSGVVLCKCYGSCVKLDNKIEAWDFQSIDVHFWIYMAYYFDRVSLYRVFWGLMSCTRVQWLCVIVFFFCTIVLATFLLISLSYQDKCPTFSY